MVYVPCPLEVAELEPALEVPMRDEAGLVGVAQQTGLDIAEPVL